MGRLWLAICAVLLCSSVAYAGYATSKKDLERAAELAVERAAEKAAERAVEQALNSGNSSTITVTVKEAYKNTKKTAEEAAAPGSESTRPYNPKIYDRQYTHQPSIDGEYKVSDSAEAEELGVPQEALNSSVEDLGSVEAVAKSAEGESEIDVPLELTSFESIRASDVDTKESFPTDFDVSLGLDFGLDFGSLDMSDDFGSKASESTKTETYSTSYSKTSDSGGPVDVDDEDDAEIFGMYASDFDGWSKKKQQGWVRHRPLWNDNNSRVSRKSLSVDSMHSDKSHARNKEKKSSEKPRRKLFKRSTRDYGATENTNQIAVPLASLSLDPKAPALLYQLLQKEIKYSNNNHSLKSPIPMRLYVTVPVPYLRANNRQNDKEITHITPRPYRTTTTPSQSSEEIYDEDKSAPRKAKRSNDFRMRSHQSVVDRNNDFQNKNQPQNAQHHRPIVKVTKRKLQSKSSTTT